MRAALAVLLLAASVHASAGGVYKCVVDGKTEYRDAACPGAAVASKVVIAPYVPDQANIARLNAAQRADWVAQSDAKSMAFARRMDEMDAARRYVPPPVVLPPEIVYVPVGGGIDACAPHCDRAFRPPHHHHVAHTPAPAPAPVKVTK